MTSETDIPPTHYLYIFLCENDIIIDKNNKTIPYYHLKGESSHSWNKISSNVSKKIFNFKHTDNHDSNTNDTQTIIENFSKELKLLQMLRLWFPLKDDNNTFLQRFTFFMKLTLSEKNRLKVI